MFKDASEALAYIEKEGVALVDVRFCDLPGVMQHFTIPVVAFKEDALTNGLMFDGSSIRGFTAIHESDMKLVPDVTTAFLDPFREEKTLVINFSIVDPFTDERFSRDPRSIAAKAEDYLRSTGIADTCYIGAEAEFYLFDSVEYETTPASTRYAIDSNEAAWNTGRSEEGGNSRAATSRSPPPTRWPTSVTPWCAPVWRRGWRSNAPTTRSAPLVSRRSTTVSPPSWPPAMT